MAGRPPPRRSAAARRDAAGSSPFGGGRIGLSDVREAAAVWERRRDGWQARTRGRDTRPVSCGHPRGTAVGAAAVSGPSAGLRRARPFCVNALPPEPAVKSRFGCCCDRGRQRADRARRAGIGRNLASECPRDCSSGPFSGHHLNYDRALRAQVEVILSQGAAGAASLQAKSREGETVIYWQPFTSSISSDFEIS